MKQVEAQNLALLQKNLHPIQSDLHERFCGDKEALCTERFSQVDA